MVQQGLYYSQELAIRQEQQLAPHQIMSLEILTVPLMDLQARLNQEIETNPTIERSESAGEQLVGDPLEDMTASASADSELAGTAVEKDEALASLVQLDDSWHDYVPPSHARQVCSSDDVERRRYFFDSLTAEKSLEDDLLEQLRTSDIPDDVKELGEVLIGNIDEMGYLRVDIEEMLSADLSGRITRDKLDDALATIQAFEPAGIGARDLRECLLLQLERAGRDGSLAHKIVDKYLQEVSRNHIPQVAKALGVSTVTIYDAWKEVQQLQPRPGSAVSGGSAQYVLPEVTVTKEGDDYVVTSNREYMPKISITERYLMLLDKPETPTEIKNYIREKINNGKLLIKSLSQRQSTVQRIAEVIVERQQDFFDLGEDQLKPMTMSEVADVIGVHETTVSRAIANKFVQTPRGLLPLKHFFAGGFKAEDGAMKSSRSVKHMIQQMVGEENPKKPLSDQAIVKLLTEEGLKVARRTVAKYREELGIQSSHLRRNHNA